MGRADDIFERISREGEAAIDAFIVSRKSEELFLDFKRSADQGGGNHLHQTDRNNLGRAISGFANSEGGVIVWGVDCRSESDGADVARYKYPLADVAAFVSRLEGAVSGCTVPPCTGVRSIPIPVADLSGFVATYIPKSMRAPHQDVTHSRYYIRAGSDFFPAPHGVLAGLFGQRPEPYLFYQLYVDNVSVVTEVPSVATVIRFILVSDGPGVARDIFLTFDIFHPGGRSTFYMENEDEAVFDFYHHFGINSSIVSKDSFRLPPGGRIHVATLHVHLVPPFDHRLYFTMNYGCSGAPTRQRSFQRDATTLASLCHTIASLPEEEQTDFFRREFWGELEPRELTERPPMVTER